MSNSTTTTISVRFLLFPSQKELIRQLSTSQSFGQIKQSLISKDVQNSDLNDVTSPSQLRFIYCGKLVNDNQTLEELRQLSKDKNQVTLHIVVNKNAPTTQQAQPQQTNTSARSAPINTPQANNRSQSLPMDILQPIYFGNQNNNANSNHNNNAQSETPQNSPTQEEIEDWGRNIHFHGCFFNEEEAQQVAVVFDKKKGEDNLMEFTDVHMFLRHYWKWLGANNHRGSADKFPMDRMMNVKKSVVGSRKRVSLNEFREIFFLFDNNSSTQTCPHGEKARVKRATEELHRSIEPDQAFQNERFDNLFAHFDKDQDGSLSCCELELFYYMYTLETMKTQTELSEQQNQSNSKVENTQQRQQQEV